MANSAQKTNEIFYNNLSLTAINEKQTFLQVCMS